jgi:type IV pilus assembly protein PilO
MASPALEDFARRPTSYKAMVFGGVFLAFAGLYYQFAYKSLSEQVTEARNNSEQMAAQKIKLGKDKEDFRELQTKMVALKRIIDENQKALPTGAELPAFFDTLNRKVNEAGVEIRKWEYKTDIPVAQFVKVPVEIELTGTFFQLKRFFASLVQRGVGARGGEEERERIVTIENLQLTSPAVRGREILLTAKFTASTFRQEGADPTLELPSAPGGSAPGGAPLPGAGTPAGAKGRVEESMRIQDERTRKGSGLDDLGTSPALPATAKLPPGEAQRAGVDRLKGGI